MDIKITECIIKPDVFGFVFVLNTGMEFGIDSKGRIHVDITSTLTESLQWIFNNIIKDEGLIRISNHSELITCECCGLYTIKNFSIRAIWISIAYYTQCCGVYTHKEPCTKENEGLMMKMITGDI